MSKWYSEVAEKCTGMTSKITTGRAHTMNNDNKLKI